MFKCLGAVFRPSLWKKASVEQRFSYFAVTFGALAMIGAIIFMLIIQSLGLPELFGLGLSLLFTVVLLSTVLDWFWKWSERVKVVE